MTKTQISYADLAKKVGDMVLFNNHNEVDEDWYYGLIEQPLMTERLDAINEENRQYIVDSIERATDEGEKAKLTEELAEFDESGERASVTDFEIYQSYAITESGARFLINHTAELVSYSEKLGLWFWHIGHWGTSWTHVHTYITDWEYTEAVTTYDSHEEMMKLTAM